MSWCFFQLPNKYKSSLKDAFPKDDLPGRADHAIVMSRHQVCPARWRPVSRGHGTLAEERPDLVQQWDFHANEGVTPDKVQAGPNFVVTWRCGKCCEHWGAPHSWSVAISRRSLSGSNCPCCSVRKDCRCQSVAAKRPELLEEWD